MFDGDPYFLSAPAKKQCDLSAVLAAGAEAAARAIVNAVKAGAR
jgi:hypothetical protein